VRRSGSGADGPPKRRRLGRGPRRDDAGSALAVGGRRDTLFELLVVRRCS